MDINKYIQSLFRSDADQPETADTPKLDCSENGTIEEAIQCHGGRANASLVMPPLRCCDAQSELDLPCAACVKEDDYRMHLPENWSATKTSAAGETGDQSRLDNGKASGFYLIPTRPLTELAKLYALGAAKYSPRGWEKGMEWRRILDPAFRHLFAWMRGEKYDPIDGQHHLIAVAWAMFALVEYEETHPELDDIHPNKD